MAKCKLAAVLAAIVLLASCGGGGGGGSNVQPQMGSAPTPPSTPQPVAMIRLANGEMVTESVFLQRRNAVADRMIEEDKYNAQADFENVNLPQAHATLELVRGNEMPGSGVKVAVIDDGFGANGEGENHFAFDGVDAELMHTFKGAEVNDGMDHGLNVASVIAGRYAPDSVELFSNESTAAGIVLPCGRSIASLGIFAACTPANTGDTAYVGAAPGVDLDVYAYGYGPVASGQMRPSDSDPFHEVMSMVLSSSPDVVNMSFGLSGVFAENYDETERAEIAAAVGAEDIDSLYQEGQNPALLVWAAGNDNGAPCNPDEVGKNQRNCIDDPDIMNVADDPDTPDDEAQGGHWNATSPDLFASLMRYDEVVGESLGTYGIVVVATEAEVQGDQYVDIGIADYSNRCGVVAEWCIAAPGSNVTLATYIEGEAVLASFPDSTSGTSFAAPIVSGGLALMKQLFRGQLSNPELLQRLKETAKDDGIYADSSIYGHGLIDLGAALNPVGTPLFRIPDVSVSVAATRLNPGSAFGDGIARSFAGREVAAFDSLGAPFWYRLSGMVGQGRHTHWTSRLREFHRKFPEADMEQPLVDGMALPVDGWRLNVHGKPLRAKSSLLNLADVTALSYAPADGWEIAAFTADGRETGAVAAWRSGSGYGIRLGFIEEPEGALGAETRGAFGGVSAHSAVAGLEWSSRLFGWQLAADTEWGLVDADTRSGMLADMENVVSSASSFRANRAFGKFGELQLSLSQPPRVEKGSISLRLPIGRTFAGETLMQDIKGSLTPSGRQQDWTLSWKKGGFKASVLYSDDYGHIDGEQDVGTMLNWRSRF